MYWLAFGLLVLTGSVLSWQDFKARLISLWLIVLFAVANALLYLSSNLLPTLIENSIFCLCYLALLYLALQLYFFIKHRKFNRIINTQLGIGDVLIIFAIGLSLEPIAMVYFFSLALIISLFLSLLFFRKKQSIPLAGLVIMNYLVFVVVRMI